jgi:hypothetical protein
VPQLAYKHLKVFKGHPKAVYRCIEAKYVVIVYNYYIPSRSVARNAETQHFPRLEGSRFLNSFC